MRVWGELCLWARSAKRGRLRENEEDPDVEGGIGLPQEMAVIRMLGWFHGEQGGTVFLLEFSLGADSHVNPLLW